MVCHHSRILQGMPLLKEINLRWHGRCRLNPFLIGYKPRLVDSSCLRCDDINYHVFLPRCFSCLAYRHPAHFHILEMASSSSIRFIPQSAPAGGVTITQPPQTATSYFKIAPSQPICITFGWNMTSVIATPTHLTVSAVCDNGNTYAVGPTDGIIPGTATQVVYPGGNFTTHSSLFTFVFQDFPQDFASNLCSGENNVSSPGQPND